MGIPQRPPLIPTPRPSEPSALELAIHRFEQEAKSYHYKQAQLAQAQGTQHELAAKKAALQRDWEHLQRERIRLSTHAQLQEGLDKYREDAKNASPQALLKEPHHPTTVLARNLTAAAEPKPSLDHDPHHIVMGSGRWQKLQMMRARLALHIHGIGINDPINGVWLPRNKDDKGHWATPEAPAHKEIHRFNYETWIVRQFGMSRLSELQVRNRLHDVKLRLTYGNYPAMVMAPKDKNWDGENA